MILEAEHELWARGVIERLGDTNELRLVHIQGGDEAGTPRKFRDYVRNLLRDTPDSYVLTCWMTWPLLDPEA